MVKDYYYILGVSQTATETEIKKAFWKLSTKFHPDKNEGDSFFEERFKEINEAYSVLSDPNKRANYDRLRAEPAPRYAPPPKPPTPEPPKTPQSSADPIKEKAKSDSSATLFVVVFIFIAFALIFLLPKKKQEYSAPLLASATTQQEKIGSVADNSSKPNPVAPPAEVDLFPFVKTFKIPKTAIKQLKARDVNIEKFQTEIDEDIAAGGERKNRRVIFMAKLLDKIQGGFFYSQVYLSSLPERYNIDSLDVYIEKITELADLYLVLVIEYFDTTTQKNTYEVSNVIECKQCTDEQIIRTKDQLQSMLLPWKQYTGYKYYHFNDYSSASRKKDQLLAGY